MAQMIFNSLWLTNNPLMTRLMNLIFIQIYEGLEGLIVKEFNS